MGDLRIPGVTDEIPGFPRVPADSCAAAARYVRRCCADADLILDALGLEA